MPTNFSSGIQRSLTAFLVALLVLPPGESLAFARKKKKADLAAASESQLTQDQRVLHALNRLTFGPRPGDVAAVEAMGLDKWINEQMNPETMDDSALEARLAAYPAMRLSRHDLIERFPSPAMIRQAEQGKRGLPWNPVERAIYQDQIAQLRDRQENKAATPGTGYRLQVTGKAAAQIPGDAMKATGDDMAPPPPDMMPANDAAKPAEPPIEEQEKKLYADLDATNVVNLPPDERVKKLVEMKPEEFRDLLRRLQRPERVALFTGLTPEQRRRCLR
jgi:hypothetical protein